MTETPFDRKVGDLKVKMRKFIYAPRYLSSEGSAEPVEINKSPGGITPTAQSIASTVSTPTKIFSEADVKSERSTAPTSRGFFSVKVSASPTVAPRSSSRGLLEPFSPTTLSASSFAVDGLSTRAAGTPPLGPQQSLNTEGVQEKLSPAAHVFVPHTNEEETTRDVSATTTSHNPHEFDALYPKNSNYDHDRARTLDVHADLTQHATASAIKAETDSQLFQLLLRNLEDSQRGMSETFTQTVKQHQAMKDCIAVLERRLSKLEKALPKEIPRYDTTKLLGLNNGNRSESKEIFDANRFIHGRPQASKSAVGGAENKSNISDTFKPSTQPQTGTQQQKVALSKAGIINIMVDLGSGREIELDVRPSMTMKDIISLTVDKTAATFDKPYLKMDGVALEAGTTVHEAQLMDGDVLDLVDASKFEASQHSQNGIGGHVATSATSAADVKSTAATNAPTKTFEDAENTPPAGVVNCFNLSPPSPVKMVIKTPPKHADRFPGKSTKKFTLYKPDINDAVW